MGSFSRNDPLGAMWGTLARRLRRPRGEESPESTGGAEQIDSKIVIHLNRQLNLDLFCGNNIFDTEDAGRIHRINMDFDGRRIKGP